PPAPPLFPYTTLFRSDGASAVQRRARDAPTVDPRLRREGGRAARRRVGGGGTHPTRAVATPRRARFPRPRVPDGVRWEWGRLPRDRKSTRLNSSHVSI